MKAPACSDKARKRVRADVRRDLARHSNFACSICGDIPIVFHHIEEWSKKFSNDKGYLIPICDKCHRRIHGRGGPAYSKDDLYRYKDNPRRPPILRDKLALEGQKGYSFFVGSNFMAGGKKGSLFRFPDGHYLTSIDTSQNMLLLNILSSVQNGEPAYLIKDNELLIDSHDVWDMEYSGSSLKIHRMTDGKKTVFIDLIVKPDVIIIREMHTSFNGKRFQVYEPRAPQQRQVRKIEDRVRHHEQLYREISAEIDTWPRTGHVVNGIDIDSLTSRVGKDELRRQLEQDLRREFCKQFQWDWWYYQRVLDRVLKESSVFGKDRNASIATSPEFRKMDEAIKAIKTRYSEEFEQLEDVVAEYDGKIWLGNFQL